MWERHLLSQKIASPKLNDFITFLLEHCSLYNAHENRFSCHPKSEFRKDFSKAKKILNKIIINITNKTINNLHILHLLNTQLCRHSEHILNYRVGKNYLATTSDVLFTNLQKLNVCLNCLRLNHKTNECEKVIVKNKIVNIIFLNLLLITIIIL